MISARGMVRIGHGASFIWGKQREIEYANPALFVFAPTMRRGENAACHRAESLPEKRRKPVSRQGGFFACVRFVFFPFAFRVNNLSMFMEIDSCPCDTFV